METIPSLRPLLILTGFGPFHGVTDNPSMCIINELTSSGFAERLPGFEVMLRTLEVSVEHCHDFYDQLAAATTAESDGYSNSGDEDYITRPTLIVHVGVDGGAQTIKLEQTAYNDMTFRCADERGFQPLGQSIDPKKAFNAPSSSALPLSAVCDKLNATEGCAGMVALSQDAGRFLCNYTYYKALSFLEGRAAQHSGGDMGTRSSSGGVSAADSRGSAVFVHVPPFEVLSQPLQVALVENIVLSLASAFHGATSTHGKT